MFLPSKGSPNQDKKATHRWVNILASEATDKGFMSGIYKHHL